MKNKVIIWDEEKYGSFTYCNTYKLYTKDANLSFDFEIDFDLFSIQECPTIVKNGIIYEIISNIIELDNNINILFAYPIDLTK